MMDLGQAAEQSGVVPKEKVVSLLSALKRVPDFSWLLTGPHPSQYRLQGDIISDFPVALVDEGGNPRCKQLPVIVLNNTCDLQPNRSKFVTVAPAFDFEQYAQSIISKRGEQNAQSHLHSVRANNIYELLWLPSFFDFKQGAVVFLDRVGSVSTKLYEDALASERRLASFSQNGFYFLLIKLTNHIARMESGEIQRVDF